MPDDYIPLIAPIVVIDHDREKYKIQMELPGVKRGDIDLEVSETSVCIRADRKDANIAGCYFLAHPVNVEETDAAFDGSMLYVEIPFKVPIRGKRVEVREGTLDIAQEEEERRIELERF